MLFGILWGIEFIIITIYIISIKVSYKNYNKLYKLFANNPDEKYNLYDLYKISNITTYSLKRQLNKLFINGHIDIYYSEPILYQLSK